jgi:hypothetical protein
VERASEWREEFKSREAFESREASESSKILSMDRKGEDR